MKLQQDNKQLASRKYQLSLLSMVIISLGLVLSDIVPGIQVLYPEFVAGILGVVMLYLTGNIGNKFVVGRYLVERSKVQDGVEKADGIHK